MLTYHFSSYWIHADTTDVQTVRATALDELNAFTVQCEFISGSNAQGCLVVLMGRYDNLTERLTRNNTKFNLVLVKHSQSCYRNVIAFDIESNGSVGLIAVPGYVNELTGSKCNREETQSGQSD